MAKRWYEYIADIRGKNGGNLLTTAGALIMLISLALPWYYVRYRLTSSGIPGLRLILEYISGDSVASPLYALAPGLLALSAFYFLLTKKASRWISLFVVAAVFAAGAAFYLSIPFENFGSGLYLAAAGLCAAAVGSLAKI